MGIGEYFNTMRNELWFKTTMLLLGGAFTTLLSGYARDTQQIRPEKAEVRPIERNPDVVELCMHMTSQYSGQDVLTITPLDNGYVLYHRKVGNIDLAFIDTPPSSCISDDDVLRIGPVSDIGLDGIVNPPQGVHKPKDADIEFMKQVRELNEHFRNKKEAYNLAYEALDSLKEGMLEEAIKKGESALKLYQDEPMFYNNLGSFYIQIGRLEDGKKILENGLKKTASDNIRALRLIHLNLGDYYFRKRDYDKALKEVDASIELDPLFVHPYIAKSRILHDKGCLLHDKQYLQKSKDVLDHALTIIKDEKDRVRLEKERNEIEEEIKAVEAELKKQQQK